MDNTETYDIYIIRGKSPLETGLYVGVTHNFASRKYAHKNGSSRPGGQFVDNYIYEHGGWNSFVMYPYKTGVIGKQNAWEMEGECIDTFHPTLNKNRSGVDSINDFKSYYLNWMADYEMQNGRKYCTSWREKNPHYFREYYRANRPPRPETLGGRKIRAEFLKLGKSYAAVKN